MDLPGLTIERPESCFPRDVLSTTNIKLKAWLRTAKPRTVDALIEAMGQALQAVRPGAIVA